MMFNGSMGLIYTRYCYLSDEEKNTLYKEDPNRLLLELAVIKSELPNFNMDLELKMTVLALLARHEGIHMNSEVKL
jgi:hypothetical protein